MYSLHVFLHSSPLPRSPFSIRVKPSDPDASKSVIVPFLSKSEHEASVGDVLRFKFEARDRYGNTVS